MISIPNKIPIRIFPVFWVLVFLLSWLNSGTIIGTLIWSAVIVISVLVHEYGHALTALAFGQEAEIDLVEFGGVTRRSGPSIKPWQNFLVVLNGPVAGLLLYFFVGIISTWIAPSQGGLLAYALKIAQEINLIWTIFNLFPILPLDGGHLLQITLEKIFGFKGVKATLLISVTLALLLGVFFLIEQQLMMSAILLMIGFESYRKWTEVKNLSAPDTSGSLQHLLTEAEEDLKAKRYQDAFSKLLLLREEAKSGALYILATQYIARLLAEQGQFKQAYEWLLPIKKQLSIDYLSLLQQLAYRLQDWNIAVEAGRLAYEKTPQLDTALLNALAYAIMGEAKPAVGWIRSAIHLGLTQPAEVLNKREFDAVRDSTEFQNLIRHFSANTLSR